MNHNDTIWDRVERTLVGLLGLVSVPALAASTHHRTILPPAHHDEATTTSTTLAAGAGPTSTTAVPPPGQGVTAIGDSILIDAATDLQHLLPGIVIDARVGQQLDQVQNTVAWLNANGDIGTRVVIELGTNGPYSAAQLTGLLSSLGPIKQIVLVNTRVPRPWQTQVNATIATVARSFPHATLLDWYSASGATPQDFYTDGVHLNPAGSQYLASLIAGALTAGKPVPPGSHNRVGSRP